jgi:hypothetical protein
MASSSDSVSDALVPFASAVVNESQPKNDSVGARATDKFNVADFLDVNNSANLTLHRKFYQVFMLFAIIACNIGLVFVGNIGIMIAVLGDILAALGFALSYSVETDSW